MTQTGSVHAHALMRAPAARPLKRMFIWRRRTQPTGHSPFFPLPRHLIQGEKRTMPTDIFHTPSAIFLAGRGWRGQRSISHVLTWLFQLPSASTAEARWSCVRPARATNPTAETAHYCLTSHPRCKHRAALTAITVNQTTCGSGQRQGDFMLWR